MITLPPHCSHKMQPLDVAVFGPLKTWLRDEHRKWMRQHPGQRVTLSEVSQLFGASYLKASSPSNAISGFRASGIFPYNDDTFTEVDFIAAEHALADRIRTAPEHDGEHGGDVRDQVPCDDDVRAGGDDVTGGGDVRDQVPCDDDVRAEGDDVTGGGDVRDQVLCDDDVRAEGDDATGGGDVRDQEGDGVTVGGDSGDIATDHPLVKSIAQRLVKFTAGHKIPATDDVIDQLLVIPKPSPRESSRRTRTQRSTILTSTPVKRALAERESKERKKTRAGKKLKLSKESSSRKGDRKESSRTEHKTKSSRTEHKTKSSRTEDICMFCGEGVSGRNESWIRCSLCGKWCHEECSGGSSSAFICDFCK